MQHVIAEMKEVECISVEVDHRKFVVMQQKSMCQ
jgi:hypothetical protein